MEKYKEVDISKYYHPNTIFVDYYGYQRYENWSAVSMEISDATRQMAKQRLTPEQYEKWLEEWLQQND